MKKSSKKPKHPLKTLIESSGHTQKSLAEATGLNENTINHYINRGKVPGFDKACAMAAELNVPLKTLAQAMGYKTSDIPDDVPPK